MSVEAIGAVDAGFLQPQWASSLVASEKPNFAQMLMDGLDRVNDKVVQADQMAVALALDDSIPPHQVTIALEHARLALQFSLQVRSRLVESYQEVMRMSL